MRDRKRKGEASEACIPETRNEAVGIEGSPESARTLVEVAETLRMETPIAPRPGRAPVARMW